MNKIPWAVVGFAPLLQDAHQCIEDCKEALNLIRVVAHLKCRGDRDTLLMLFRTIDRSKLDYGCIVYSTASNTNLRQLDSIHSAELRLALGAFCTSPVSCMYTPNLPYQGHKIPYLVPRTGDCLPALWPVSDH